MTSSIYLRGFGSRMDNPVLGLYIDDIPVLDKNAYDFDWLDIRSAELYRGPQGTLYGRNAMCGVLSLSADDVAPLYLGNPMEPYRVTGFTGKLDDKGLTFSLNFGSYPTSFTGVLAPE